MSPNGRAKIVGVQIREGLGNQLFQYAAGLALARRHGAALELDTSFYRHSQRRVLALDRLGISWKECESPNARGALRALKRMAYNPFRDSIFAEAHFGYMPELLETRPPTYLVGYFQSWRYHLEINEELRAIYNLNSFASQNTGPIEAQIRAAKDPVMVHIRRGDYAHGAKASAKFGVLEEGYYNRARAHLEMKCGAVDYFVFSDEIETARALLWQWPRTTFVSGFSELEDIMLMSRCHHFIIANSTYSWWAARLGKAEDGTVIAPSRWFGPALQESHSTADLFPPDWVII